MKQTNNSVYFNNLRWKLIQYFLKEYGCYDKYLSEDFFNNELDKFEKAYNIDCGVCPKLLFKLLIKNSVLKELAQCIRQGDIDLEIKLIDQYIPLINLIILKMDLQKHNINSEDIFIKSIESYDGNKIFSLHIIDIIREDILNNNIEEDKLSEEKNTNITEKKEETFEQQIKNYLSIKEVYKNNSTDIDKLIKKLKIIDYVEENELKKYVYLRFGYFENIYFESKDIANIIGIPEEDCIYLYRNTLLKLKEILNKSIDNILSYNFDDGKKFIKIKKIDT